MNSAAGSHLAVDTTIWKGLQDERLALCQASQNNHHDMSPAQRPSDCPERQAIRRSISLSFCWSASNAHTMWQSGVMNIIFSALAAWTKRSLPPLLAALHWGTLNEFAPSEVFIVFLKQTTYELNLVTGILVACTWKSIFKRV